MTPPSFRQPVKGLAVFFALSLYSILPAWPDDQPVKTRVLINAAYFSKSSLDEAGTKALEGFVKLALERITAVDVFTDQDDLPFCGQTVEKCLPDVTAHVVVLERNDEAQLFARLQLASGQDQRRVRDPSGGTVRLSKLPSGIADLVEQIADAINPNHAKPVRLVMGCLQSSAEAPKNFVKQLQMELAFWLRESSNITPVRHEESQDCTAESLRARAVSAGNGSGGKELAWLGSTFTGNGDDFDFALSLWRDTATEPLVLPNIRLKLQGSNDDPAPGTIRKIGTVVQGLLGAHSSIVESALRQSQAERLERAHAILGASRPDYDAAFALFELALWGDSNLEIPAIQYADALSKHSRDEAALSVLREARDQHETANLDLALAKALSRSGDYEAALTEYKAIQSGGLAIKESMLGITETQIMANHLPAAAQAAAEAMRAFPSDVAPVLLAAQIKESKEDFDGARALYKGAIMFPDNAAIKANLALLDIRLASAIRDPGRARWDKQIELLDEAIALYPTLVAYIKRGDALTELTALLDHSAEGMKLRKQYFAGAAQDYRNALSLSAASSTDPLKEYPYLVPNLIEVEIMNGEFDQAGQRAKDFFRTIAKGAQSQTPTSLQSLRAATAYLLALAEILSGGSAAKEIYLSEVLSIDVSFSRLYWDFRPMEAFLDDFGAMQPDLKARQVAASDFISRFKPQEATSR